MGNLALEGGIPVRSRLLPFHRPWITPEDEAAVLQTLRSGWLTSGPAARAFREALEKDLERPVVLTNSCTSALFLALKLAGIQPGDRVLLPSLTFAATASVVIHHGGVPVLADVDPRTGLLTPEIVEDALSRIPGIRGLITVDYGGNPVDYIAIGEIVDRHGLFWISDAAHALGSTYRDEPVGRHAPFTAFSFYATKVVTSGEGGALVVEDPELRDRAERLTLHGLSRESWSRSQGRLPYYQVLEVGYKFNLPDPLAALGLSQYRRLHQGTAMRRHIIENYRRAFADLPLRWIESPPHGVSNAHLAVVVLDLESLKRDRDWIIQALLAEGIQTSVHFVPLHTHPAFRPYHRAHTLPLPNTEFLAPRLLSLPVSPAMSIRDVEDVVEAFRKVITAALA